MQTTTPRGYAREPLIDLWSCHRAGESRHAIALAVGRRPTSVQEIGIEIKNSIELLPPTLGEARPG